MHLKHKFGSWKEVRRGIVGETFEKGIITENRVTGEVNRIISPCGDFIVQERQCSICGLIKFKRQEVYQ